jgi:hypothetical protein
VSRDVAERDELAREPTPMVKCLVPAIAAAFAIAMGAGGSSA